MKKIISLLILTFIIQQSIVAQQLVFADLQKNSSITISGTTNIISFKLHQNGEMLCKNKLSFTTAKSKNNILLKQNQLIVEVKNFDSNNKMALKDFLKLLKVEDYPSLQVQINYLDTQPILGKGQNFNGTASISITITGVKKQYCIPIYLSHEGENYAINGKQKLNIRDFGLVPMTKMMGMIKVNEWIDIDFCMVCKLANLEEI